jgi:hypothetical protein
MAENHRRAASLLSKLWGQKPGDLPIELPVRLELVVGLKTAKTIELSVSESFLVLADKVIERGRAMSLIGHKADKTVASINARC